MFGSARMVPEIALRLRQNLSLGGVCLRSIHIGGGVGGEIPDNKRLEYALQHIHGIGRSKAHHIVCELGIENKYVKDLSKRELYSFRDLLSKYLIGNDLLRKCLDAGRSRLGNTIPLLSLEMDETRYQGLTTVVDKMSCSFVKGSRIFSESSGDKAPLGGGIADAMLLVSSVVGICGLPFSSTLRFLEGFKCRSGSAFLMETLRCLLFLRVVEYPADAHKDSVLILHAI
ncbi:hypothetical protein OROMI_016735 [Orobanche minor]